MKRAPSSLALFGMLVNSMDAKKGSDGDTGAIFPKSDVEDMAAGAAYIPGEVTDARRGGEKVTFVQKGTDPGNWYWTMPDGSQMKYDV